MLHALSCFLALVMGNIILHYSGVIMGAMAYQITSLTIVYSTVYLGVDQRKHQSSASLAFVRGIHRSPVNSPHKWPVTRKMLPFDDVIMNASVLLHWYRGIHVVSSVSVKHDWILWVNNSHKFNCTRKQAQQNWSHISWDILQLCDIFVTSNSTAKQYHTPFARSHLKPINYAVSWKDRLRLSYQGAARQ